MPDMRGRGGHVSDRPSRLSIFARRQRKRVRPALLLLAFLAILAGGYRLARDVQSEERFAPIRAKLIALAPLKIRKIVVNGRNLTSQADLDAAIGTSVGQPILGFSLPAARDRINMLPFVDHATIERHMPGTIIVTLFERRPFAVWQHDGHFKLIDRAGNAVTDSGMTGKDAQAFLQLPLVVGTGANTNAAALLDALATQPEVQSRVVAMTRVGDRRWNLLLHDGTSVLLPEGQEAAALARLTTYQAQYRLLERPVAEIDMRLPDRMVIRQRPAPSPLPETDTKPALGDSASASTPAPADKPVAATPTAKPPASHPGPANTNSPAETSGHAASLPPTRPPQRAPQSLPSPTPSGSALAPPEPLPPPMPEPLSPPASRNRT